MIAKNWKRILLIILIICCLINAITKIVKLISFDNTIDMLKEKVVMLKQDSKEDK